MTRAIGRRLSLAGSFALALGAGAAPAGAETQDLAWDLVKAPVGAEQRLEVPIDQSFFVRLDGRAPSGRYRVRAQWILSPETPRRPSANALDKTYELRMPIAPQLQAPHESHPCLALKRDLVALLRLTDEAATQAQYEALRKRLDAGECPSLGSGLRSELEQSRTKLDLSYQLYPGDELRILLERLDPATGATTRTWRAVVRPIVPKLPWAYGSEEEWIVGETARDVVEMLVYAKTRALPDPAKLTFGLAKAPAVATGPSSYQLSVELPGAGLKVSRALVLDPHAWSPRTHAGLVADLMQQLKLSRRPGSGRSGAAAALTNPQAIAIERENQRISSWLEASPLDPAAHEDGALLLAAFALREASGDFGDVRRALCRIAAHLAVAQGLLGPTGEGAAGALAGAALAEMAGREKEAVERLGALEARGTLAPAERTWARALRIRTTGDWRILKDPKRATLLEQIQHFRALYGRVRVEQAMEYLASLGQAPVAEWARITLQGSFSVDAGNAIAPMAVSLEVQELSEILRAVRGQELQPDRLKEVLASRAGRCVARGTKGVGPRVIDWGAWAEFFDRHICHAVVSADKHIVSMLGADDKGGDLRKQGEKFVEGLGLGPVVAHKLAHTRFTGGAGPGGPSPGPNACERGAALARDAPERLELQNWELLERMCPKERDSGAMPKVKRWFAPPLPAGTGYNAGFRTRAMAAYPWMRDHLKEVAGNVPYQASVLRMYAQLAWGEAAKADDIVKLYGPLKDYDLSVLRELARVQEDDVAAARPLYERMAELSPAGYLALGAYLARHGLENDAAAAYEKAVAKAEDRVELSNEVDWLVDYHLDHGRDARAKELATMAAEVYSSSGLTTLARFLERTGRYDEAEGWYKKNADRYGTEGGATLKRFYVRQEQRVNDGRFRVQAQAAIRELFPAGFERVGLADFVSPLQPGEGYGVREHPEAQFGRLGIKPGEWIVALDGLRVRNEGQYWCIRGFKDDPDATLVVWSRGGFREVKGPIHRWKYGPPRSGA